jgi:hypothetical protein
MNCDRGLFARLGRLNGACLRRIRKELAIGRGSRAGCQASIALPNQNLPRCLIGLRASPLVFVPTHFNCLLM